MIPDIKSLPSVSASLQSQSKSGTKPETKAFGDILEYQESSSRDSARSASTAAISDDGGKSQYQGGKDLPSKSEDNSNQSLLKGQVVTEDLSSDKDAVEVIYDGSGTLRTPVTFESQLLLKGKRLLPGSLDQTANNALPMAGIVRVIDMPNVANGSSIVNEPELVNKTALSTNIDSKTILVDPEKIAMGSLPAGQSEGDNFAVIQQAILTEAGLVKDSQQLGSLALDQLVKTDLSQLKAALSNQDLSSGQVDLLQAASLQSTPQQTVLSIGLTDIGLTNKGVSLPSMSYSLGEPGWDGELMGRVNLLVRGGMQEAKIQLNPPELGRLEIKISIDDDTAKVVFGVDNALARDAIEQAMPRLRDLLNQGGLQLAHSEVFDHSQSQQHQRNDMQGGLVAPLVDTGADTDTEDSSSWQLGLRSSNSVIDYYI